MIETIYRLKHARIQRVRERLALVRLLLLYGALCFLILYLSLHLRQGWRLPPPDPAGTATPHLGVTVSLLGRSPESQQRELARLEAGGFTWIRQRFSWSDLEPRPGEYDWTEADRLLQTLSGSQLALMAVLDGSPAWARSPRDAQMPFAELAPPASPQDFADFAAAFARRYGDQIDLYQIWDEPNIYPHWGNRHIDPIGYGHLARAAMAAIRAEDGGSTLLLAALAPTADRGHTAMDEVAFLNRLYAAEVVRQADGVAVQPFGFGYEPAAGYPDRRWLAWNRLFLVRQAMVRAGDPTRPLWVVRFGWNRAVNAVWGRVSPENQIRYGQEAVAWASHYPWIAGLGWAAERPTGGPKDPQWGFSLSEADGSTTPLWEALATAGRRGSPTGNSIPTFLRPQPFWSLTGLYLLAAGLLLWRVLAAVQTIPWRRWMLRWRRGSPAFYNAAWAVVLLLYFLATWPPLIGLCLAAAAWLILVRPLTGLWLALCLLPFHFQHKEIYLPDVTWTLPPAQAALLCTIPSIWVHRQRRDRLPSPRILLLMGSWLLLQGIGVGTTWHWPAYAQALVDLAVVPLLLLLNLHRFAGDAHQRRAVAVALFLGAPLLAGLGLYEWFQGLGTLADGIRRLVGPTFSPNHTALYLERGLFLGLALIPIYRSRIRTAAPLLLLLGIVLAALALTASRGALLLGLPAGVMIWLWRGIGSGSDRARSVRMAAWLSVILSGLAVALLITVWPEAEVRQRLVNSATLLERFAIWRNSLALWRDHFWAGVGSGGFFWRYPAYVPIPEILGLGSDPNIRHPHNVWLEFAVQWGVAGLIWLLGIVVWLGNRVRQRSVQGMEWGLLAGLAAGFAHGQVDAFMGLADLAAWNWVALILLLVPIGERASVSPEAP